MNDFPSWCQVIKTCNNNDLIKALGQGIQFFRSISNTGLLPEPFADQTPEFCYNTLREIIQKMFLAAYSFDSLEKNDVFNNFYDFTIDIAIKSLCSQNSYFVLLYYLFNYPEEYEQNNEKFIHYLTTLFLTKSDQLLRLIEVFANFSPLPLEDYMTFYFLAYKFQNINEDVKNNVLGFTVQLFFGSISMQNSSTLRTVPTPVLDQLGDYFLQLFLNENLDGSELFPFYNFLKECLGCNVEKQVFSAKCYIRIFDNTNERCQNKLIEWLVANNFFPNLVAKHPHLEVLNMFAPLLDRMSQSQLIPSEIIFELWEQSLTAQASERETYFKLISHCLLSLGEQGLPEFLDIVQNSLDFNVLALFYKTSVIEMAKGKDEILSLLLNNASDKLDLPVFRKIFIDLVLLHDEDITKKINQLASSWVDRKIYHPSAYDIINSLFKESPVRLKFAAKNFLQYITEGVEGKEDLKQLYKLLLSFLKYYKICLPFDNNIQLYKVSEKPQFWNFMSDLLDSRDLESTPNHDKLIRYFIENEDISNTSREYIEFMMNYYLKYSILCDESVKKISSKKPNCLLKPNIFLNYLFEICGTVKNSNCASILSNFLLSLFSNSKMDFNEKIDYFVSQCISIMAKMQENGNSQLPQIFQLLLSFIDSEEGKIDFNIFGVHRMKDSNKLFTVRVQNPNKKFVKIRITPQTSVLAIKNALSALFSFPIEMILIDSNNIPRMETEGKDQKIIVRYKKRSKGKKSIINFHQFPVFPLSTTENTSFLINLLQNDLTAKIVFKLLNRFLFILMDFDNTPEFYLEIFNTKTNNHPYFFKYMTQRFYRLLKEKIIQLPPQALAEYLNKLIRIVLTKQFKSTYLVSAIDILADYYNEKKTSEEICNLLEVATTDHKYIYHYLKLITKLIPEKTGVVFNYNILIKLIKLTTNDDIYNKFCSIIECATGESSLYSLLISIITNPISFIACENYIEQIVHKILLKIPDNALKITEQIIGSFNIKQENSIPILCKVLKALFYPEFKNGYDLTDFVTNLLVKCAFTTSNEKIQKSIFDLSAIFNNELQDSFIMSCSVIQSYNFNQNLYTRSFKSLSGLANMGCTCYMNSILQQLSASNSVIASLAQSKTELRADIQLLLDLFSNQRFGLRNYYSTSQYCEAYSKFNTDFHTHEQEDAVEYFSMLLESCPQETKELFEGKYKYIISKGEADVKSQILSEREEPFTTIDVSVSGIEDLVSSIRQLLTPESLTKDNQYQTQSGEKVDALRYTRFHKLPRFLVFHLKRFELNYATLTRKKINSCFEFPTTLNMSEFSQEGCLYRLRGAVIHMGVAEGGHYVSFIRRDRKWILCDDSSLSERSEESFLELAYGSDSSDQNAYLLFFERDESSVPEISDSQLYSIIPEKLRKEITENNENEVKSCSLLTNSCYNYFLNRAPSKISTLYFFNSLCHSVNYDRIIEFSQNIDDCKFFIENSTSDLLEILSKNSIGNDATNSLIDIIGKSTDVACINSFLSESTKIVNDNDLLKKVGKIFEFAASKDSIDAEGFQLISTFLSKNFSDREKLESFDLSSYFEVLIYAKRYPDFNIEPLFPIIGKTGKSEALLLSSLRFLISRGINGSHIDRLFTDGCDKLQLYKIISSLTMPESFERTLYFIHTNEISRLISGDENITTCEVVIEMTNLIRNRSDAIIKLLKENHQVIMNLLVNTIFDVRVNTESLIIALFLSHNTNGNSNDLTFENNVPRINHDSQALVNDLVQNIVQLPNCERNIIPEKETGDDENRKHMSQFISLAYFRTLNWFSFYDDITIDFTSEIINALFSLIDIMSKKSINPNYTLFEIAKLVDRADDEDADYLITETFKAFFQKDFVQDSSTKDLSGHVALFLPIITSFESRNSEMAEELLKSKQFLRVCKKAGSVKRISKYPPLEELSEFVETLCENSKEYNKRFDGIFD